MNYISHHEVARRYRPDSSRTFLFGSFVTDIARMSGTRGLLASITDPELLAGIKLHRFTNKPAFDGQPLVVELEKSMKASFDRFLPWRTATQASRAGKDLLFDGIQFSDPRVVEELLATLRSVISGEVQLSGIDSPEPILDVVGWINDNGPPRYDDTQVVAHRLFATLSRTRTPLEPEFFSGVVGVLEEHQPTIFEIGPSVMQQTVENLSVIDLQ